MSRSSDARARVVARLAETFRAHGYDGASLSLIGDATGLGKGSLYHLFPGGKEEMAETVLDDIDTWFRTQLFAPLRDAPDPDVAIGAMLDAAEGYFRSGGRICLAGAFALGDARDRFATRLHGYFTAWVEALADALIRVGRRPAQASALAEDSVAAIQGALVLARALGEPAAFARVMARLRARLTASGARGARCIDAGEAGEAP